MSKMVRIGACQTPEFIGKVDAAIEYIQETGQKAETAGVDLLLFPECFLQGYILTPNHLAHYAYDLASPSFARLLSKLSGTKPTLAIGIIEKSGNKYFNSAVIIEQGKLGGVYRKTHLLPGETVFEPGNQFPIFKLKGLKYGLNICYDAQFPEAAKAVADQGARVILHPAQNMMRRQNAEKWKYEHNRLRQQRAKETSTWFISSDVTGERDGLRIGYGPTAAINPQGEVAAQVPLMTVGMITIDL